MKDNNVGRALRKLSSIGVATDVGNDIFGYFNIPPTAMMQFMQDINLCHSLQSMNAKYSLRRRNKLVGLWVPDPKSTCFLAHDLWSLSSLTRELNLSPGSESPGNPNH